MVGAPPVTITDRGADGQMTGFPFRPLAGMVARAVRLANQGLGRSQVIPPGVLRHETERLSRPPGRQQ